MALDASGDVFVGDNADGPVFEIVAGTGGAASGQVSSGSTVLPVGSGFDSTFGLSVEANGDVFVADVGNKALKEIEPAAVDLGTVNVGSASATMLIPNPCRVMSAVPSGRTTSRSSPWSRPWDRAA